MKKFSGFKVRRLRGTLQLVLIGIITYILLFTLTWAGITPEQYDIHVGLPASVTILASKDVEDGVTTAALKAAAAAAVEPSYRSVDTSVNAVVLSDMQEMFEQLRVLRSNNLVATRAEINEQLLKRVNTLSPVELNGEMLSSLLLRSETDVLEVFGNCEQELQDALNSTLPEGQESAAVTRINRNLLADDYDNGLVSIATEVLRNCIQPNMLVDTEITEANRAKARDAIETEMLVKGEVIVREGDIVTDAQYQMISNLGLLNNDALDLPLIGGLMLLVLIICGILALFLHLFSSHVLHTPSNLLLLAIILVLETGISLVVRDLNAYLMPVSLGAMLLTLLLDKRTALFVNCVISFLISMLVSSGGIFSMTMFSVLLMSFACGPIVVQILSRNQLRTAILLTGLAVGANNFLVTLAVGLVSSANLDTVLINAVWAIGSGIFSAILTIGLQALLEWIFNLATNAKLIELSNPNQPLLRRLLLEAPGTYHHSIIVANLAEAAAAAVGANGLLARTGAYYHDIGKLKRPIYFKENQLGDNPHDRTDPRVSAAILTAHTRDGAQMAQKERLPQAVQDIIRQHHGDSLTLYFYDKAVKLYGADVDISAFRYDGPRPHSKEAAIVMLADTIEAATRTLANPTPEKMEALIRKLVSGKLNDGQLNDSALTFSDLDHICGAFCTVLTGVFHERIEYPDIAVPPREPAFTVEAEDGVQSEITDASKSDATDSLQSESADSDTATDAQDTEAKTVGD